MPAMLVTVWRIKISRTDVGMSGRCRALPIDDRVTSQQCTDEHHGRSRAVVRATSACHAAYADEQPVARYLARWLGEAVVHVKGEF